MQKLLIITIAVIHTPSFFSEAAKLAELKWTESYEQAAQQSKTESKPIVLFFTGSDWCVWCTRLEKEVFDTQELSTHPETTSSSSASTTP